MSGEDPIVTRLRVLARELSFANDLDKLKKLRSECLTEMAKVWHDPDRPLDESYQRGALWMILTISNMIGELAEVQDRLKRSEV